MLCDVELCDVCVLFFFFFFQAEDGRRDLVRSRGLGDVYKRQRLLGPVEDGVGRILGARRLLRDPGRSVDEVPQHRGFADDPAPREHVLEPRHTFDEAREIRAAARGIEAVSYTPLPPPTSDLV